MYPSPGGPARRTAAVPQREMQEYRLAIFEYMTYMKRKPQQFQNWAGA
jgi:hypothetical protein